MLLSLLVMLGNHQHWDSSIDIRWIPWIWAEEGQPQIFSFLFAAKCPSLSSVGFVWAKMASSHDICGCLEDRMEDGPRKELTKLEKTRTSFSLVNLPLHNRFPQPSSLGWWLQKSRHWGTHQKKHAKTRRSKSRVPIFEALGSAEKIPRGSWNSVPVFAGCFFQQMLSFQKNDPYFN